MTGLVDLAPYLLVVWLFAWGLYGVVTSRNLIHLTLCLTMVVQSSTYVILIAIGYEAGGTAPVHDDPGAPVVGVDPVVQALTLTDIVVSAVLTALMLVFAVRTHQRTRSLDPADLRPLRG